jgi:hypothetical protein
MIPNAAPFGLHSATLSHRESIATQLRLLQQPADHLVARCEVNVMIPVQLSRFDCGSDVRVRDYVCSKGTDPVSDHVLKHQRHWITGVLMDCPHEVGNGWCSHWVEVAQVNLVTQVPDNGFDPTTSVPVPKGAIVLCPISPISPSGPLVSKSDQTG